MIFLWLPLLHARKTTATNFAIYLWIHLARKFNLAASIWKARKFDFHFESKRQTQIAILCCLPHPSPVAFNIDLKYNGGEGEGERKDISKSSQHVCEERNHLRMCLGTIHWDYDVEEIKAYSTWKEIFSFFNSAFRQMWISPLFCDDYANVSFVYLPFLSFVFLFLVPRVLVYFSIAYFSICTCFRFSTCVLFFWQEAMTVLNVSHKWIFRSIHKVVIHAHEMLLLLPITYP